MTRNWYPQGTMPEPFVPAFLDDLSVAFGGADKFESLMPPAEKIPEEFTNSNRSESTKWGKFLRDKFYAGLESVEFDPKEGIDPERAWNHVLTILGSWSPKHEYKMASCAYLLSLWFEDVRWVAKPREVR